MKQYEAAMAIDGKPTQCQVFAPESREDNILLGLLEVFGTQGGMLVFRGPDGHVIFLCTDKDEDDKGIVELFKSILSKPEMTDEDRKNLLSELTYEYCVYCGAPTPDKPCNCRRDE